MTFHFFRAHGDSESWKACFGQVTQQPGGGGGRTGGQEGWEGGGGGGSQTGSVTKSNSKYSRIKATLSMLLTLPRQGRTGEGYHSKQKMRVRAG